MNSPAPGMCCMHLVEAFVKLGDTLIDDYNIVDLLQCLVETCTRLPAVDTAGVLLAEKFSQQHVMAYTTEEVLHLELFQVQEQEGPWLDCLHTGQIVSASDLAEAADRWPRFAPRAMQDGVRAVHALPMRLRAEIVGALNLFTSQPGSLAPQDLQIARALADAATIGILHERTLRSCENVARQLQTAFNVRIVIEQAKGLLAERTGLGFSEVFNLLRAHARRKRMRLSDVARGVVQGSVIVDIPPRNPARETAAES